MLAHALRILRAVERVAAAVLLAALVTVVFAGTIGRYIGRPVLWSDEVAQALFVWVALLAADLTFQRSGHFSVDILANLLPPRARLALDLLIYALIAALLALLVYAGFTFAKMTGIRLLPMTMVPVSFATAALPIGFALMLITTAEHVVRRLGGSPETAAPGETREVM